MGRYAYPFQLLIQGHGGFSSMLNPPDFTKFLFFMKNYKKIGILGGMGPEATADLYMKIIRWFQITRKATYDADFPAVVIYSVPIPNIVEKIESEKTTLNMLIEAALILEKGCCDFIVIACNSVQYLLPALQRNTKIPIIGIAETNARYLQQMGYKNVAILSTITTVQNKIYDDAMTDRGIKIVKPNKEDQEIITQVILAQLNGGVRRYLKKKFLKLIDGLKDSNVEAILLACTELPLVVQQSDVDFPLVDCTRVYADEAARVSLLNNKLSTRKIN